eukprot:6028732-Amphidinium_carterae.1
MAQDTLHRTVAINESAVGRDSQLQLQNRVPNRLGQPRLFDDNSHLCCESSRYAHLGALNLTVTDLMMLNVVDGRSLRRLATRYKVEILFQEDQSPGVSSSRNSQGNLYDMASTLRKRRFNLA